MGDRDPLTRGPGVSRASGVAPAGISVPLTPYTMWHHDLGEAYTKYYAYAQVIANGGPLAPQLGNLILYSEVEESAARMFGQARPHMVEGNADRPILWTDVLLESLTPDNFTLQESGMYRCQVQGISIEVSGANYVDLLSGNPHQLLHPFQILSDEQKEARVRSILHTYLNETQKSLLKFDSEVRASLRALEESQPVQAPIHPTNSGHTGRNQPALPNPNPAPRINSAQSVISPSDAENGGDEQTQDNINPEASEAALLSDSTNDKDYVPSAHILTSNSTGSENTTGYISSSTDNPPRQHHPTSVTDDDEVPTEVLRGNSNYSVNESAGAGFTAFQILRVSFLAFNNIADPRLINEYIAFAVNNHVVGNRDANGSAHELANANDISESSGHVSDVTHRSIYPWLMNVETPSIEDDGAQSPGSNISVEIKSEPVSSDEERHDEEFDGEEPHDEEPHDEEPHDEEPYDEEPHDEEPYDEEPYDEEPYDEEPYDEESYDEESYDEEPYDGEPYEKESNDEESNYEESCDGESYDMERSDEESYGEEPYGEEFDDGEPYYEESDDEEPQDEAARSTDAVPQDHGMKSHGSKRSQDEINPSESENKPLTDKRYSQLEGDEGPEFVQDLVDKGATCTEIEEEYSKLFGIFRSTADLFEKFAIIDGSGMFKSYERAKRQKTMPN
ncbi:hypothetical protein PITC_032980 [Penicillium italicum]|uniref:Uncharacterized protein n=1 Tax=Penicillium italicum TaxID=40296 RepID=A0A0A2L6Y2_PENIT|nr:hypothetical protein PITC_032980 [Penicillium italicum]